MGRHGEIRAVLAHGSYLVNPATDGVKKPDLLKLSRETMLDELHRCDALEIPFLIVHPGSHGGAGELTGVGRVQRFLRDVMGQFSGSTMLLIETTSGLGTGIGCRFEHIRDIMGGVDDQRIGACIDTCHIYGAGYDVRTRASYTRTFRRFDSVVGLVHLKAIHLNDAKGGLGSRVDRHHHIGMGELGMKPFSLIMNDNRFAQLPKILETPKKRDGIDMDGKNIALLKNLVR
jgi:deoxyribonuclease-4